MTLSIERIHHVAYRCKDAKETVQWYGKMLNMGFVLAIAEDQVPSTKEPDPYMHIFLDAGGGNVLAFFELPTRPEMGRDPNTPIWVQHIAFRVKDRDALLAYRTHLEANGVEVLGVTDRRPDCRTGDKITSIMPRHESDVAILRERVAFWASKLRVSPRVVRVQRMTHKWGSCSTRGTITLASDLVDKDRRFQDFVVAHELLHLRVPNHGRLFKALMTAHVPYWRQHELLK